MNSIELLYTIVLLSEVLILLGLAVSILVPKYRIWPPPSKNSWQYWVTWISVSIAYVGVPAVGILDWDSLGASTSFRFLLGGGVIVSSTGLFLWGIRTLGWYQSQGLEGGLVTEGPYRYTRNPQYLALILFYAAVILITNSFMALVSGSLFIIDFAIVPFSEEPWLRTRFGTVYEEYCEHVPRFLGIRSFRRT